MAAAMAASTPGTACLATSTSCSSSSSVCLHRTTTNMASRLQFQMLADSPGRKQTTAMLPSHLSIVGNSSRMTTETVSSQLTGAGGCKGSPVQEHLLTARAGQLVGMLSAGSLAGAARRDHSIQPHIALADETVNVLRVCIHAILINSSYSKRECFLHVFTERCQCQKSLRMKQ